MFYQTPYSLFLSLLLLTVPLFSQEEMTKCPYFTYSPQELGELDELDTDFYLDKEELKKWDTHVAEKAENVHASLESLRIITYLYVAQREAAILSQLSKSYLAGSFDPVSFTALSLFLPDLEKPQNYKEDPYSNFLAKIIGEKLQERMKKEEKDFSQFKPLKEHKKVFFVGINTANWIPWYTLPAKNFWPFPPPPPEDPIWREQIKKIRTEQKKMTEQQKESIYKWAALRDPADSDWRAIANDYLFTHTVSLDKIIQVRFALMVGIYDGFIVGFGSKYQYDVKRPSMYDPTLTHEIPVPNHPSYPSNHSLIASLSATILSYYIPSQASHWQALENEAGLSRILGGIHYPLDDTAGRKAGEKLANHLLMEIEKSKSETCLSL